MREQLILLVGAASLAGCATASTTNAPQSGGIVHQFTQGTAGGKANCYWFETRNGPVVVDVPLTSTEAKHLLGGMAHPYRIYITAAKPERYGSVSEMTKPDVPIYSTPAVATEIKNHGDQRLGRLRASVGDEVPSHAEAPVPAIEERTHDMLDDIEVELIPLGPAESEASLAVYLPKTGELITGDVVAGHEHVDLTWGRSVVWQDRIAELKALEPKLIYPGHGSPGGPELLDQTLAYLKAFHEVVASHVKPGAPARISATDAAAIKQQMMARFPNLGRPELLDKSIPAEYAVQLAAAPAAPVAEPTAGAPAGSDAAKTPAAATTTAPATTTTAPATTTTTTSSDKTPPPATVKTSSSSSSSSVDDLLGADSGSSKGKKKKKK
jgi:glyoxylase-like metal-dependent hydrolase (beta-lactamase superfamily II)